MLIRRSVSRSILNALPWINKIVNSWNNELTFYRAAYTMTIRLTIQTSCIDAWIHKFIREIDGAARLRSEHSNSNRREYIHVQRRRHQGWQICTWYAVVARLWTRSCETMRVDNSRKSQFSGFSILTYLRTELWLESSDDNPLYNVWESHIRNALHWFCDAKKSIAEIFTKCRAVNRTCFSSCIDVDTLTCQHFFLTRVSTTILK